MKKYIRLKLVHIVFLILLLSLSTLLLVINNSETLRESLKNNAVFELASIANIKQWKFSNDYSDETIITVDTYERLKSLLKCNNKDFVYETYQRGDYWVLKNFIRADHGAIDCYRYVTFVTQGDFTYLENLEVLVERWRSPISVSLHAPGSDFHETVSAIRYLKDCSTARNLISQWVTFHIYFHKEHIPKKIPSSNIFNETFDCKLGAPYLSVNSSKLYKNQKGLLYPINVGRNIGRDAVLTHYFLSLDVELYPNRKLGNRFLNMLARNSSLLTRDKHAVFVLLPFEVESNQTVPDDKTTLQEMLQTQMAIPFHKYVCPECHKSPLSEKWMIFKETKYMEVMGISKRIGHWEPLFISSQDLPYLDERLSWEGVRDKMTQAYAMCLQDFDFLMLSNAFVTHHPGIKRFKKEQTRDKIIEKQWKFIREVVLEELKKIYGDRKGCVL